MFKLQKQQVDGYGKAEDIVMLARRYPDPLPYIRLLF
jgi:hypothetical protein